MKPPQYVEGMQKMHLSKAVLLRLSRNNQLKLKRRSLLLSTSQRLHTPKLNNKSNKNNT